LEAFSISHVQILINDRFKFCDVKLYSFFLSELRFLLLLEIWKRTASQGLTILHNT